jgi:peptidoglycan/xylan/chitin deacetylase (PgdA/CDA1 family)
MKQNPVVELQSGIFTLSLDFELIWGTLDKPKHTRFRRLCAIEREEVIDRLLALFAEYKISATWCTVGHLFLDRGKNEGDRSTDADAPIFYGRDLIERIRKCSVPQEIGSHTFTHKIFDDPQCTRSVADEELTASVKAARDLGLTMTSFAFPRNRINHVDLLQKHGFTAYRGQDAQWYAHTSERRWFHRVGHLLDMFCATAPTPGLPVWHEEGIWEIPGSMLYTPSHGLRRILPARARVHRARKGLRSAAAQKKIFHLWFHPTDVVVRKEAMLDGLRQILEYACELRDAGRLSILPMSGITELMNCATHQHQPLPSRQMPLFLAPEEALSR